MDRYPTREWPGFRQFVSMDGQQVYWVLIRAQLHQLTTVAFSGSGGILMSEEGTGKINQFRRLVYGNEEP